MDKQIEFDFTKIPLTMGIEYILKPDYQIVMAIITLALIDYDTYTFADLPAIMSAFVASQQEMVDYIGIAISGTMSHMNEEGE